MIVEGAKSSSIFAEADIKWADSRKWRTQQGKDGLPRNQLQIVSEIADQ